MVLLQITRSSLTLLSLLLLLAALGSDHWLLIRKNQRVNHSGLWKFCVNSKCLIPLKAPDHMKASQGFLILATLAGFLSFLVLVASFFCSHLGSMSLILVSAMGSFSAGLCAMSAMAVYTVENAKALMAAPDQVSYGWSFSVSWAACPLCLLTSVVTLLSQRFSTS